MPIYAYRCSTCGHAKDVLQKISDPAPGACPACGADTFVKQVTAAGFQLKGSGWYVTDFRGGNAGGGGDKPAGADAGAAAPASAPAAAPAAAGAAAAGATAGAATATAAPAGACGKGGA